MFAWLQILQVLLNSLHECMCQMWTCCEICRCLNIMFVLLPGTDGCLCHLALLWDSLIFIYCLSQSQLLMVMLLTVVLVLQLAAACLGMGDQSQEYRPPITFVVVQKRHHTRLFPGRPDQGDRSGNIMPGTFNSVPCHYIMSNMCTSLLSTAACLVCALHCLLIAPCLTCHTLSASRLCIYQCCCPGDLQTESDMQHTA